MTARAVSGEGSPITADTFVIHTRGLAKSYSGPEKHRPASVNALQNVDLQVPQHAICGFLGPNGAGKSTTIKLLLGLTRPSGGSGSVFGLDIVKDSTAIRQRVGYLAQDPRYYEHLTARETLRFTARFFYSGPSSAIEERVSETLLLVGLSEKADRPIKGFSGGERQRLGIAQAQINYPDLLILDEPAASLDPMGRRDVLEVMERLRKHTTIFYSTHILDDVQRVSDTVAILNHDQLIAQGPIAQILAGSGGSVYTLTLRGDGQAAQARLARQPWVTTVTAQASQRGPSQAEAEATTLHISVTDAQAAEAQLLRLVLADARTVVTEFGRKQHTLEDVFLDLVAGGKSNGYRN